MLGRGRPSTAARALAALGALAAAVPLLAACGGSDPVGPSVLPTTAPTTASPSPTATPTAAPTRPANADDYSAEGMEAFARYAIEVFNFAYRTGDTEPLSQLQASRCSFCRGVTRTIRQAWDSGGRTTGSQIEVTRAFTPGPASGVSPAVIVDLSQSRFQRISSTGRVEEDVPAVKKAQVIVDLAREGEAWRLADMRRSSSS